jgi:hypothetical protein
MGWLGGGLLMLAARRPWALMYTHSLEMRDGMGRAMKVMALLEMRDGAGHGASTSPEPRPPGVAAPARRGHARSAWLHLSVTLDGVELEVGDDRWGPPVGERRTCHLQAGPTRQSSTSASESTSAR